MRSRWLSEINSIDKSLYEKDHLHRREIFIIKGVICFKDFCLGQRLRTFVQKFLISGTIHSPSQRHSHLILDPGSADYDEFGGGFAPSEMVIKCRSRIQDQVAVSLAGAVDCA